MAGGHAWWGDVWQGAYMVGACIVGGMCGGGVHGRGHAWQLVCVTGVYMVGGMHGRGACVAGGMCGRGGHEWWGHVWGGMHGRGHAWCRVCMAGGVHGRYYEIWSMSGWYASYWNAFLFNIVFEIVLCMDHKGNRSIFYQQDEFISPCEKHFPRIGQRCKEMKDFNFLWFVNACNSPSWLKALLTLSYMSPFFAPLKTGFHANLPYCLHITIKRSKVPLTKTARLMVRVNEA